MKPIAIIIALLILAAGSAGALEICEMKTTDYRIMGDGIEMGISAGWDGKIKGEIGDWMEKRHPGYIITGARPILAYSEETIDEIKKAGVQPYRLIAIGEPTEKCYKLE